MDKKVLAISWLNGQVKALYFNKGEVKSTWHSPQPVNEENDFKSALTEILNQTGFDGFKVMILVSNRKLIHHLVEVPPVRSSDLEYYVERKANQLKTFDESVAFSYLQTPPTRISNALLVNIYPRSFIEKLATACREADLHLSRMFSMHSPMRLQLSTLPCLSEEVVALAAEVEGTTALLIGGKDGKVYFGRTIYSTWRAEHEYVGTEIMRSILFVKQQFGVMATRVFLFGHQAEQYAKPLTEVCGLPVEARQYPTTIEDWLKEALKLPEETTENLVTVDWRKEPQTRLFIKMVGFLAVLIIAGITAWIAYVEKEIRAKNKLHASLQPLYNQLQEAKKEIGNRKLELEHRKEVVKLITDNPLHPVPGWFFGYLSDVLPEDFVLKELHIYWTNGLWKVRISGVVQPVGNKPIDQTLALGIQVLQNRLERSPFHFKVTDKIQIASQNVPPAEPTQPPTVSDASKDISTGIGLRREAGIGFLGDDLTNTTRPTAPPFLEKVKTDQKSIFWIEGVMQ